RRVFHWSCMTTTSRQVATRKPFYAAQQGQCYRYRPRRETWSILDNFVLRQAAIEHSQPEGTIADIHEALLRERVHRRLYPFRDIGGMGCGNRSRPHLERSLGTYTLHIIWYRKNYT